MILDIHKAQKMLFSEDEAADDPYATKILPRGQINELAAAERIYQLLPDIQKTLFKVKKIYSYINCHIIVRLFNRSILIFW